MPIELCRSRLQSQEAPDAPGDFLKRDGRGNTLARIAVAHWTRLAQEWTTGPPADGAEEHVSHLLLAELLQPVRSADGRCSIWDWEHTTLCGIQRSYRYPAGRDHNSEFPASFGEVRIDGGIAGGDQCSPQGSGVAGFQRHDGGRYTYSRPKFDQEWGTGVRSGDAPSEEMSAMVLWHESACGGRRGFGRGAHGWSCRCQWSRHQILPKLLRAEDEVIFGDAGYTSDEYKRGSRQLGMRWCVQDKRKPGQNLSVSQNKRNRKHSSIRARMEHVFRVIKRQFGFTRTRYRRLMKNAAQVTCWWAWSTCTYCVGGC